MSDDLGPPPPIRVRAPLSDAEWAQIDRVRAAIRDGTYAAQEAAVATGLSVSTVRAWAVDPTCVFDRHVDRCIAWARRQPDPAVITLLSTSSSMLAPSSLYNLWAMPEALFREHLEWTLKVARDPDHPEQRLFAAHRERIEGEVEDSEWLIGADGRLLRWTLDPALPTEMERDAETTVERPLAAWTRREWGIPS